MFRQKKLNRFLYRNVRAMSLYNTEPTHRGNLKIFKVSTHHTTEPTHRGTLKILKVSTHHTTESTHRGTLKTFKVFTHHTTGPTHRDFFEKNQSPQHRAHTQGRMDSRIKKNVVLSIWNFDVVFSFFMGLNKLDLKQIWDETVFYHILTDSLPK